MGTINRILDANINRAAEGMRVLEDIARFMLDNPDLCRALKQCRHDLRNAIPVMPAILARDVRNDVGTGVSTESESIRSSVHDIAVAAGNRCTEALRVIEEILKLEDGDNTVESIRYRMYEHVATVVQSLGSRCRNQWRFCFILTTTMCTLHWKETLRHSLDAGCDCVQVREKSMTTKQLIQHTKEVITIANDVPVIVNDRVDVAIAAGASGVHLGVSDMPITLARQQCGTELFIGATVHSVEEAKFAVEHGADYLGIGPMFSSTTKPDISPSGPRLLQEVLEALPRAHHLAIGGITPEKVNQLYEIGCKGVAVSAAVATSSVPSTIVRDILSGMRTLQSS